MNLLDTQMEKFCFIDKSRQPDGQGGFIYVWTESTEFQANARLDSSIQAKIAQVQGVTSLYTITTKKDITLEYHDIIKRLSDGKIFRVTSDGDDNKTPEASALNMRQVSAEEWELPR